MVAAFFYLPLRLQHSPCTNVFTIVLLLLETVCAIVDNIGASTHSTTGGNNVLDHTGHFTITYLKPDAIAARQKR